MRIASMLVFALAILLASCSTNKTPSATLLTIDQDWSKAAVRVVAYDSLPRCSATVTSACSDPAVVATLKADAHDGDAKLDAAWKSLADPDIASARAAVTTMQGDLAANHIP